MRRVTIHRKAEVILVGLLIFVGILLRLYRYRELMTFQGDQGRDAIVVADILTKGDFTLLGPVTSVGNMYLGPFYYYFMLPFLALSYPDPIGPALGVALFNIASLPLLYIIAKKMFGKGAAMIALYIYTLLSPAVWMSHYSWNPNLTPFFGLLLIWFMYKVFQQTQYHYLIWIGLTVGVLAQLHYITLVTLPVIAVLFGFQFYKTKSERKKLIGYGVAGLVVFLLTWTPLVIFNFRHDHLIINAFKSFFFGREQHFVPKASLLTTIQEMEGKSMRLLIDLMFPLHYPSKRVLLYSMLGLAGYWWFKDKKQRKDIGFIIVSVILLFTTIGIALYSGDIYDHYIGFAFPALAMWWGYIFIRLIRLQVIGKAVTILLLMVFTLTALNTSPIKALSGPTVDKYKRVASDIRAQPINGKYNIVLLSESKDYRGMSYRYFLQVSDKPPASFEDYTNLDTLVVIDELHVSNPLEVEVRELEMAQLTKLVNTFTSPEGPDIMIYSR